jgi:hypothetical protein
MDVQEKEEAMSKYQDDGGWQSCLFTKFSLQLQLFT